MYKNIVFLNFLTLFNLCICNSLASGEMAFQFYDVYGEPFAEFNTNDLDATEKQIDELILEYNKKDVSNLPMQPLNVHNINKSRLIGNKLHCVYFKLRRMLSNEEAASLDKDMQIWFKISGYYIQKEADSYAGGSVAPTAAATECIRREISQIKYLQERIKKCQK